MRTTLTLIVILALCTPSIQAQGFFNKLKEQVGGAVEDEVSNKAEEESREKTRDVLDGIFDGKEKESEGSSQTREGSEEEGEYEDAGDYSGADMDELNGMLEALMGDMNKAAALPDDYTFDFVIESRFREGDEDWQPMTMLFDTKSDVIAFKITQDGETSTTVIDPERDLMAVYMVDKKGNKEAMAMANMLSMAGALNQSGYGEEIEVENPNFRKTGRTKKIAGYTAEEYEGEGDGEKGYMWMSRDLPVSMSGALTPIFDQMGTSAQMPDYPGAEDGWMLQVHTEDIDNPSKTTDWETTDISKGPVVYKTSDWPFQGR